MTVTFAVNCSILFTDLPLEERAAAARRAGFSRVEFWWPFDTPTPDADDVARLVRSVDRAGVSLAALNLYAGDMGAGERGVLGRPDVGDALSGNLEVVRGIAERTGCTRFNALVGTPPPGMSAQDHRRLVVERLGEAARVLGETGGTVLVEPLSGVPGYPVTTAAQAVDLVEHVRTDQGVEGIAFLLDAYHLTVEGDDPAAALARFRRHVGHVQIADAPGRRRPGTGHVDVHGLLSRLVELGYTGDVALEYHPEPDEDPFVWMDESGWARNPRTGLRPSLPCARMTP